MVSGKGPEWSWDTGNMNRSESNGVTGYQVVGDASMDSCKGLLLRLSVEVTVDTVLDVEVLHDLGKA